MSTVNDIRVAFVDLAIQQGIAVLDNREDLEPSQKELILTSDATVLLAKYAAHLRYVLSGLMLFNEPGVMNVVRAESNVALREAYRCLLEMEDAAKLGEIRSLMRLPPIQE